MSSQSHPQSQTETSGTADVQDDNTGKPRRAPNSASIRALGPAHRSQGLINMFDCGWWAHQGQLFIPDMNDVEIETWFARAALPASAWVRVRRPLLEHIEQAMPQSNRRVFASSADEARFVDGLLAAAVSTPVGLDTARTCVAQVTGRTVSDDFMRRLLARHGLRRSQAGSGAARQREAASKRRRRRRAGGDPDYAEVDAGYVRDEAIWHENRSRRTRPQRDSSHAATPPVTRTIPTLAEIELSLSKPPAHKPAFPRTREQVLASYRRELTTELDWRMRRAEEAVDEATDLHGLIRDDEWAVRYWDWLNGRSTDDVIEAATATDWLDHPPLELQALVLAAGDDITNAWEAIGKIVRQPADVVEAVIMLTFDVIDRGWILLAELLGTGTGPAGVCHGTAGSETSLLRLADALGGQDGVDGVALMDRVINRATTEADLEAAWPVVESVVCRMSLGAAFDIMPPPAKPEKRTRKAKPKPPAGTSPERTDRKAVIQNDVKLEDLVASLMQ